MTGRRYYYTDPLAAAYMEKHFGMRFLGELYGKPIQELTVWLDCLRDGRVREENSDDPRIYIHPDSLHLLELRERDLFSFIQVHKTSGEERVNYGLLSAPADIPKLIEWGRYAVIQRDGKAFHWPESEDA